MKDSGCYLTQKEVDEEVNALVIHKCGAVLDNKSQFVIMPFGLYKGTALAHIPLTYLDRTIAAITPQSWIVREVIRFISQVSQVTMDEFVSVGGPPDKTWDQLFETIYEGIYGAAYLEKRARILAKKPTRKTSRMRSS